MDRNGAVYYQEIGSTEAPKEAPYYYITETYSSRRAESEFRAEYYDNSKLGENPQGCYNNEVVRENVVDDYLIDPTDGFINSVRCGCLPAIEGYLTSIRNILQAIKNCFESVLVTNEFDAGICKAILTQYLCDFVFDLLGCAVNSFSFEGGERDTGNTFRNFFTDLSSAGDKIKERAESRYGNTATFRALFNERQLIHSVCLAAFGYDWQPDLNAALSIGGGGFNIESTGIVAPATRRFMSFNPNNEGVATHVYHVGYFLTAGEDLNWQLELVCSTTNDCEPKDGFEGGWCDCARGSATVEQPPVFGPAGAAGQLENNVGIGITRSIAGGSLVGGESVGSGDGNPYQGREGEIYIDLDDPIRYDKVRLRWTPRDREGGKPGEILVPIRQEGLAPPAYCAFSVSLVKFSCGFNSPEDGFVFIEEVREWRSGKPSDEATGVEPFSLKEPIRYQIDYTYQTAENPEDDIPRYIRVQIKDENGDVILSEHTDDFQVQPGNGQVVLPFKEQGADDLVGGKEDVAVATSDSSRGSSKFDKLDLSVQGERRIEIKPGDKKQYLVFASQPEVNSDILSYIQVPEEDLGDGSNKKSITEYIEDKIEANKNNKQIFPESVTELNNDDKYEFKGVDTYLLNSEGCDSDLCVGYFVLESESDTESIEARCEDKDTLEWEATIQMMDGRLVNGKAQYVARQSPSLSNTRPTDVKANIVISCDTVKSSTNPDDSCSYDKELGDVCECGTEELTDAKIEDGFKVCIPTEDVIEEGATVGSLDFELSKQFRPCPTQDTQDGFISVDGNGKCFGGEVDDEDVLCGDGEYFNTELEECRTGN